MDTGFSVSCPDLVALAQRMTRVDPGAVYQQAARDTAAHAASKMIESAKATGAPDKVTQRIGVFQVGEIVHAGSQAPEAHAHEYGDAQNPPAGWARMTMADNDFEDHLADRLSYHLDRSLR